MRTPIPASYWVMEGLLLAGEYPGSHIDGEARPKLEKIVDAGIRAFFDLTEPGELFSYDVILNDITADRGVALTYERVPIRDLNVPQSAAVTELLGKLARNVAAGTASYVHCWGGIGRTGTIVGCWLVQQEGLDGDAALKRIAELRRSCADRDRQSPETEEQRAFVRAWPKTVRRDRECS